MFNFKSKHESGEFFAIWASVPREGVLAIVAEAVSGKIVVKDILAQGSSDEDLIKRLSGCKKGLLLLAPDSYSSGLVQDPIGVDAAGLPEAIRWSFAKDAELDMTAAEYELLPVKGEANGGGLLKDSHWIFALPHARLKELLGPWVKKGLKIQVVDVLALAQRNLCWQDAMVSSREGGHASFVVGSEYSSLGIVSRDGEQLFHKQLEWTSESVISPASRDRLILDLQRNLGYFERRQSALGLVQGYVYGKGASEVAVILKQGLGSFDWRPGDITSFVSWDSAVSADAATCWLLGAMRRWL